jgi:WD40 repeat protein
VLIFQPAGTARYVGTHKGPVTCICLPSPEDGELGKAGLILSGSVDGNIKVGAGRKDMATREEERAFERDKEKLKPARHPACTAHGYGSPAPVVACLPQLPWSAMLSSTIHKERTVGAGNQEGTGTIRCMLRTTQHFICNTASCLQIWEYQGRVIQKPTVCVQTLYGHTGTITGLFAYGPHIVSSSTDKTIKIWKAVDGRQQLVYPWYNLQVRVWPHDHSHGCISQIEGRRRSNTKD